MPKQTNLTVEQKRELLLGYVGQRAQLNCQVGVCIWGEMFTLEPGHGLCEFDLVRDGMRIGISCHIIYSLEERLDNTLAIVIQ